MSLETLCIHGVVLNKACLACENEKDAVGNTCIHGVYLKVFCQKCAEEERGRPHPQDDMVNQPPHYTQGAIECWDAIESALTPEEWRGYIKGTILQYVWREKYKGGDEDMAKVGAYLKRGGWLT